MVTANMRHSIHIYRLLSIWLHIMLTFCNADREEDEFVAAHGNVNGTSGVWPEVRAIASDETKLKLLCKQAHQQMGLGAEDVVNRAKLDTDKKLSFHNYNDTNKRNPISLDVITYGVERAPEKAWYFTKGTKSDCVFYLILWDVIETHFRTGLEICGIHMPTPETSC